MQTLTASEITTITTKCPVERVGIEDLSKCLVGASSVGAVDAHSTNTLKLLFI
jgi:hypothetical protein